MKKVRLNQMAQQLPVTDHMDYRDWLYALYKRAKGIDASYSYAQFSTDLTLGSSNANLVVSGKRDLTQKTGSKVAAALKLPVAQKKFLLALVAYDRAVGVERDTIFQEILKLKSKLLPNDLDRKQLAFFQNWYNAAILELLRLPAASDDPEWISRTLNPKVALPKVKNALSLLCELGYLAVDKSLGRLVPTDANISTGNEVAGMAIIGFHHQMLDIARHAIDDVEAELREISAVTLSVSSDLREEIKQEIIKLRKRMIQKSNEIKNPDEVVQLNFQMFPVGSTKGESP